MVDEKYFVQLYAFKLLITSFVLAIRSSGFRQNKTQLLPNMTLSLSFLAMNRKVFFAVLATTSLQPFLSEARFLQQFSPAKGNNYSNNPPGTLYIQYTTTFGQLSSPFLNFGHNNQAFQWFRMPDLNNQVFIAQLSISQKLILPPRVLCNFYHFRYGLFNLLIHWFLNRLLRGRSVYCIIFKLLVTRTLTRFEIQHLSINFAIQWSD